MWGSAIQSKATKSVASLRQLADRFYADPANCQSIFSWSALMQAACRTHLKLVELLLRHGADPLYQDHEGRSALSEMATCVPGLRVTELI